MSKDIKRKLGNSTSVKIGKRTYSSYDMPNLKLQSKKVNTVTEIENAPRNVAKKSVDNQANKIQTATRQFNTETKPLTATKQFNTAKTQVSTRTVTKVSEQQKQYKGNIQRQTALSVKAHTIISSKQPIVGHFKKPISSKNGFITNAIVRAENVMNSQNDGGTSTIAMGLTSVGVGIKTFKTAQLMTGTKSVQTLAHAVTGIKKGVAVGTAYSIIAGRGIIKSANLVRGVVNGTVKVKVSTQTLNNMKNATISGIKMTGYVVGYKIKNGANGVASGLKTGIIKGGKLTAKAIPNGIIGIGNTMMNTNDTGTQSIGLGIKSTQYAVKGIKLTPKVIKKGNYGIKTAVNGTLKTGRGTYKASRYIEGFPKMVKKFGIKNTISWHKNKAMKAISKAGGSVVQAMITTFKTIAQKTIAPLLLIIVCAVIVMNMLSAPVASVGAMFGGSFTNKSTGTDVEIHEYLLNAIDPKKEELVKEIFELRDKNLKINGGDCDGADLYTLKTGTKKGIDITESDIKSSIYTTQEVVTLIEPMFQTIIFSKYNLEPTQAELDNTLEDIWNTLIRVTSKKVEKNHAKIFNITINLDGYDELLAKYFTDDIDKLANLSTRTAEQDDQLENLKDNYELCLTYMEELKATYSNGTSTSSNGGTSTDLSGVTLINGTRTANNAIISLAEMQVGNDGGQPYWSWYGFEGRVAWCACFVSWCESQTEGISSGAVDKFSYCPSGIDWFKSRGQWANGGYTDLVAGDIIFFDWGGDGVSDHVGLVRGTDGESVYTIEGNSGDKVRCKSYPINSSVIMGYGLPNYK